MRPEAPAAAPECSGLFLRQTVVWIKPDISAKRRTALRGILGRIQEHFPVLDKGEAFSRFKKRGNERGNEKVKTYLFTLT